MPPSGTPDAWTRMIARAAAHEIRNVEHALGQVLALAEASGALGADYVAVAGDGLGRLRRLADDLRALAGSGDAAAAPARIDLACADALAEVEPGPDQRVAVDGPLSAEARVRGTAAALRIAVRVLLRHALAASPATAVVRLRVGVAADAVVVTVDAPEAPAPQQGHDALGFALAGAIAREIGGELRVDALAASGGARFALHLARAP